MPDTLNQYKSNLTPEEVDQALHNIAQLGAGIDQAKRYAEQAQGYAESIDPDSFVKATALLNLIYPVGSIYLSAANVSPEAFIGGTWQPVEDVFLLAAGSLYPAGSTGGEAAHTLSQEEMPNYQVPITSGDQIVRTKKWGPGAYVQTVSSGWGIPDWETVNITAESGGSGQPHNNMPPYLAVYMWKRTA